MNKRNFLKASGALLTGGMLSQLVADERHVKRTNWAGNYEYSTDQLRLPETPEEVRKVVKSCDPLKALGSRHSFNGIADSTGTQISLKNLHGMALDRKLHTVTVDAGVAYGHLAPYLHSNGYALHNLASLPHISVAGACATATHGSGSKNGNLSTAVSAVEMITADGETVLLSRERNGEEFNGAVVGLGALGIITKVTLAVQPTYQVSQAVYQNLSFDRLEKHLDEIFLSGYSVSLFTDWQNHQATEVWIKRRIEEGSPPAEWKLEFFGAKLASENLHPIIGHSAENCTEQRGIPGPWYERLPHFRMNFTPSSGEELQAEYFVPREKAYEAIVAVERLRNHITPHLFISEFRTIDADQLWMSPCYRRPSLAIHFTWKPEWPVVKQILPLIEEQLAPFEARPHWAKVFTMTPSRLQSLYPKLTEYRALVKRYDPQGKFRNAFLTTNVL